MIFINEVSFPASYLKYKVDKILFIYKNGKIDNTWNIASQATNGNERAWITSENFDPTAVYEVDYIPLESYKVSAQTPSITVKHQANLGSVINSLVDDVSDVEKRVDVVENSMVRKDTPVNWFTPTLLNGWLVYNIDMQPQYHIDSLGYIHLKGNVKSGTVGYVPIFMLPKGFRPIKNMVLPVYNFNGSAIVLGSVEIRTNGDVCFWSGSNYSVGLEGIIFKAEQ